MSPVQMETLRDTDDSSMSVFTHSGKSGFHHFRSYLLRFPRFRTGSISLKKEVVEILEQYGLKAAESVPETK